MREERLMHVFDQEGAGRCGWDGSTGYGDLRGRKESDHESECGFKHEGSRAAVRASIRGSSGHPPGRTCWPSVQGRKAG